MLLRRALCLETRLRPTALHGIHETRHFIQKPKLTTMDITRNDNIFRIDFPRGPHEVTRGSRDALLEIDRGNPWPLENEQSLYGIIPILDGTVSGQADAEAKRVKLAFRVAKIQQELKYLKTHELQLCNKKTKEILRGLVIIQDQYSDDDIDLQKYQSRYPDSFVIKVWKDNQSTWLQESEGKISNSPKTEQIVLQKSQTGPHPAFWKEDNNSLFHNLKDAVSILQKCKDKPGIKELLKLVNRDNVTTETTTPPNVQHPFIVIEGLDGTGKTTLVKRLEKSLNASLARSPPPCVQSLRSMFDDYPPLIRRAYYTIGNYLAAYDIENLCQKGPVVMDRFWHSTAAYTIATECGSGTEEVLPPLGHNVYQWPKNLLQPTFVVLLHLDEETRAKRISNRNETKTSEEERLEQDRKFRIRINGAYKRMGDPKPVEIDASQSEEMVAQSVIAKMKEHGIEINTE